MAEDNTYVDQIVSELFSSGYVVAKEVYSAVLEDNRQLQLKVAVLQNELTERCKSRPANDLGTQVTSLLVPYLVSEERQHAYGGIATFLPSLPGHPVPHDVPHPARPEQLTTAQPQPLPQQCMPQTVFAAPPRTVHDTGAEQQRSVGDAGQVVPSSGIGTHLLDQEGDDRLIDDLLRSGAAGPQHEKHFSKALGSLTPLTNDRSSAPGPATDGQRASTNGSSKADVAARDSLTSKPHAAPKSAERASRAATPSDDRRSSSKARERAAATSPRQDDLRRRAEVRPRPRSRSRSRSKSPRPRSRAYSRSPMRSPTPAARRRPRYSRSASRSPGERRRSPRRYDRAAGLRKSSEVWHRAPRPRTRSRSPSRSRYSPSRQRSYSPSRRHTLPSRYTSRHQPANSEHGPRTDHPCYFFSNGGCRHGDNCRFRHDITLQANDEYKGCLIPGVTCPPHPKATSCAERTYAEKLLKTLQASDSGSMAFHDVPKNLGRCGDVSRPGWLADFVAKYSNWFKREGKAKGGWDAVTLRPALKGFAAQEEAKKKVLKARPPSPEHKVPRKSRATEQPPSRAGQGAGTSQTLEKQPSPSMPQTPDRQACAAGAPAHGSAQRASSDTAAAGDSDILPAA